MTHNNTFAQALIAHICTKSSINPSKQQRADIAAELTTELSKLHVLFCTALSEINYQHRTDITLDVELWGGSPLFNWIPKARQTFTVRGKWQLATIDGDDFDGDTSVPYCQPSPENATITSAEKSEISVTAGQVIGFNYQADDSACIDYISIILDKLFVGLVGQTEKPTGITLTITRNDAGDHAITCDHNNWYALN